ncbi:MAG: hypothetical protein ACK5U8_08515 [Deltaproteobacteria bacterium]|jgi:hypothetical protein
MTASFDATLAREGRGRAVVLAPGIGQHGRVLRVHDTVAALSLALAAAGCACLDAPDMSVGLDGGRRPRLDTGPLPDGFVPRRPSPMLPPVDVEITLPWGAEARVPIELGSAVSDLDLVLSVDTTQSFSGEINALQSSFAGTILPALRARSGRIAFAVTRFEDFPSGSSGDPDDLPFELLSPVTTEMARIDGAIARLDMPLGGGGDIPESGYEALYQIATGEGLSVGGVDLVPAWSPGRAGLGGGDEAGVGFREGSLRAVLHVTDAPSHDGASIGDEAHDRAEAIVALRARRLRVIGIASSDEARGHLEDLALATGATLPPAEGGVCRTGLGGATRAPLHGECPLVFDLASDGTGLSDVVVQAIADLLRSLSYAEVHGEAREDRLGFVRGIEAVAATAEAGSLPPMRSDERPADGLFDTFRDVERGVTMRFEAHLVNDVLEPADYDQHLTFTLEILGDGAVLTSRTVRITVPRGRLPTPDASVDAGPRAPDASEPDASEPDASEPDASEPDASEPDASEPDASEPDASEPDDAGADDAEA